jgi:hypothetical protein
MQRLFQLFPSSSTSIDCPVGNPDVYGKYPNPSSPLTFNANDTYVFCLDEVPT